ncbi:MAG TPA: cytochrome c3 family protein [Terriglobia bacterium]|nr:cytochrome c3 family protein [Terriglobia bacterium]
MRRRLVWLGWSMASILAVAGIAIKLQSKDRGMFLPGQTSSGHYQIELACDSCHVPFQGAISDSCMKCHQTDLAEGEDSHPKSKFTDPRNAERIARLDATSCVTCHVEHRPEITGTMGVTLPADVCFYCHSDIARERPSHQNMAFDSCASAGCHNFHDNRALYTDFLLKHQSEPEVLSVALVTRRPRRTSATPVDASRRDDPHGTVADPRLVEEWASTAHAQSGVNCSACHVVASGSANKAWTDHPGYQSCETCHKSESQGFSGGRHGMRLAAGLGPMSPSLARLPMNSSAKERTLDCGSCHSPHTFDTRRAAADGCLDCHADRHSLAYKDSPHFALWRAESEGRAPDGSGVGCATCHLPRVTGETGGSSAVRVDHNQNANLRPNEKMIRSVCLNCHGLGFSIDALADPVLIETNFRGRPARHIESIDMALRKAAANPRSK